MIKKRGGNDDATDEENRRYIKERVRDLLQLSVLFWHQVRPSCVSVKHLIIFLY